MENNKLKKQLTKDELLSKISEIADVDKKTVRSVIDTYERMLLLELNDCHEVKLGIFGKIKVSERSERQGVNPSTGEKVIIPSRMAPKFAFSKAIKEFVLHEIKK